MTPRLRTSLLGATILAAAAMLNGCAGSSSAVTWDSPQLRQSVDVRAATHNPDDDMVEFEFTNRTGEYVSLRYRLDGTMTAADDSERWFRLTIPPHDTARVQHRAQGTDSARVIVRQG